MFPQRCLFRLWSSGLWHRVVRSVVANRCHFPNTHLLWPEPIHFPEFSLSPSIFLLWAVTWTPASLDFQQKINRRGYNRQCRVRDTSQDSTWYVTGQYVICHRTVRDMSQDSTWYVTGQTVARLRSAIGDTQLLTLLNVTTVPSHYICLFQPQCWETERKETACKT